MQNVKYGVRPVESTRSKASSVLYLYYSNVHFIFVRVLGNSSQRAYFRSCDGNGATPLADRHEIGRFMGFPVAF